MNVTEWNLDESLASLQTEAANASTAEDWEAFRLRYLGKKNGIVTHLYKGLRDVPKEEKAAFGQKINVLKKAVDDALAGAQEVTSKAKTKVSGLDLTLPGIRPEEGAIHPLTRTLREMLEFFRQMGYDVAEGPELETTFFNFTALNTPDTHPARADADTYYINDDLLLRTQTSGTQVRYMKERKPPIRMVAPGRVYRRDDDPTHSPMFHQVEGLVVDKNITFGHLRGTLLAFAKHIFGDKVEIRLRPSYFPFTEPSAEVDVSCVFCSTDTCRVCKGTGWIEILGSGMVDPNVFGFADYDADEVTGFAFGIGIERVAMLKYAIPDIRYLYANDRRFLEQFKVG